MTLVSFGGWNFPQRRVLDDRVGTRDSLTPELQLPSSKLMQRFQPVLGAVQPELWCEGQHDIHESSMGASAPHRGTVFRWRIHECKGGRSQCRCASSPAGASKAANQYSPCHDFASECSQVVTACQCSVKLHSKVGRCSLAGQSSTTDVHVQFTFCLSVVQVKRCQHCFGFT